MNDLMINGIKNVTYFPIALEIIQSTLIGELVLRAKTNCAQN
jgi:hypothetical protein